MLGDGPEQFRIVARVDGKLIQEDKIHHPFFSSKTTIGIGRWNLFKAIFRKQFEVVVEISVHGTLGAERAIMMLDPADIEKVTAEILDNRKHSIATGTMGIGNGSDERSTTA